MVIFHLAAGTGEQLFPDAFMNSVVTTRNLLDASLRHCLWTTRSRQLVLRLRQPPEDPALR